MAERIPPSEKTSPAIGVRPLVQPPRLSWPVRTLALAFIYFAGAKLGLSMAVVAPQVTTVWPPTGIALAAILLLGLRAWPGIALGAFLANVTANEPVATAAGIAAGNTLEAVAGSWLLRRAGFEPSLKRLSDVLTLVWWGALVSTAVSATIGVSSLCLGGMQRWSAFGALWSTWWIGDVMGDLIVAPLLLVWASPPRSHWTTRGIAEAAGLVGGLVGLTLVVFAGELGTAVARYPLQYTVFPFIIWAGLRFGQRGTTTVAFVASALAIWSTFNGFGPFVMGTWHESRAMLQLFMAIAAVTGLLLCAAITERNAAREIFGRYVSPAVARHALECTIAFGGEVVRATAMFVDLRGFTALTQRLPASTVVELLNEYYALVERVCEWEGGVITQFLGDGAVVIFGGPLQPVLDHARRAVRAAVALERALAERNRSERTVERLIAGVGICTGEMIAGNLGSGGRVTYTIVGDAVNQAARLRDLGASILMTDSTRLALGDADGVPLRRCGPVALKGIAAPVEVYAVDV